MNIVLLVQMSLYGLTGPQVAVAIVAVCHDIVFDVVVVVAAFEVFVRLFGFTSIG